MKVFLGWSGERSYETAQAFHEWLPKVIQAVVPFISSGIPKGKRWGESLAGELETTKVGILCLTRDNLDSNWILYEAGALSNAKNTHVCTFLLDVKPTDVEEPLASFQHTTYTKGDIQKLLKTINDALRASGEHELPESTLDSVFETFWPELEKALNKIVTLEKVSSQIRSEREILEEILEIVRKTSRPMAEDTLNKMSALENLLNKLEDIEKYGFLGSEEINELNDLRETILESIVFLKDGLDVKIGSINNILKRTKQLEDSVFSAK